MSSIEDRIALLEHDLSEVFDVLEQIARDADLLNCNIMRTLKAMNKTGQIAKPQAPPTIQELTFTTLKFDSQKGDKLGEFEIAYKTTNPPDKFDQAFNILRNSNATIKERYHGQAYAYSYWIYGEGKIYRQKLKQEANT